MAKVKAALVQTAWTGDKDSMVQRHLAHIDDAAKQGAQVICLQELFYGPYFCQVEDKKGYAYTENEDFFGGTATNLGSGVHAPYTSRMLVRLPQDPTKFNGTVIVEWLNVTGQSDLETVWPVEAQYLMQHGYGYIGVSAQLVGADFLPGWDPTRYAGITHPGLFGTAPSAELLAKWNQREQQLINTNPNRVPPLALPLEAGSFAGRSSFRL